LRVIVILSVMFLALFSTRTVQAQFKTTKSDSTLVQFSGQVMADEDGQLVPLGFANVGVVGTTRGTYANYNGFFSLVVKKGETVEFTYIGYKTVTYTIPDSLSTDRYTLYQMMSRDDINLPVTVIYPWPSRENFKNEFLAMDVSNDMYDRAMQNLSPETLERIRETLPKDGRETVGIAMKQEIATYYYRGQLQPQRIFDPIAWAQFIKAWKDGKFKKKDKK